MSDGGGTTNVAIACQGGGSHTAFTAGFLQEALDSWDDGDELVGISGTSGGSFNALATWYGLVTEGRERAIELLEEIWADFAADDPGDRAVNEWLMGYTRLESSGAPLPAISPYHFVGDDLGKRRIVDVLERHIDFGAIPDLCGAGTPELVVGTVNVNAGEFETFTNEDVTPEAILASSAVPNIFEAVELNGHLHWDGLFSQNPPIDDLMAVDAEHKPDELWVVQINPQEFEGEPKSLPVIADRRNELSGNISLNQELKYVERVNAWVEEGYLPEDRFSRIDVRRVEMGERFHCSTKLDRSPGFIEDLIELGREQATEFLAGR